MKTLRLDDSSSGISVAADIIKRGGVVAFPTETVYGLGADALNPEAAAGIFEAKGRPADNPLIVHIAGTDHMYDLCDVPEGAKELARRFWPGPLTIVMPRKPHIPDIVTAGLDTVGIRMPSNRVALELIRASGSPIAAPSANISGRPSDTTAQDVITDFDGRIDAVIVGDPCEVGVESTVVSLANDKPRLLRPGGVTLESLRAVLGEVEVDRAVTGMISENERVSSPGMKYRHYAPKAPVIVVCGEAEETAAYIASRVTAETGAICFDEYAGLFCTPYVARIGGSQDMAEQARRIFSALRFFDGTSVNTIYAQCPPDAGIGLAVANRIKKAAGFQIVDLTK